MTDIEWKQSRITNRGNQYFHYPNDDMEFKDEVVKSGGWVAHIYKNGIFIDKIEADSSVVWQSPIFTHIKTTTINSKDIEQIYENCKIYAVPKGYEDMLPPKETNTHNKPIQKEDSNQTKGENMTIPPLNQILYGPPGTGKTYSTIDRALEILRHYDKTIQIPESREDKRAIFDEYRANKQIEFVTFHQSFSYEEFVEGIKPNAENEKMTYEVKDGIFKQICTQARQNLKEFVENQQSEMGDRKQHNELDKDKTLWRLYTIPAGKVENDYFDECIEQDCVKVWGDYDKDKLGQAENGDYIVIPSANYGEMSKTIRAFGVLGKEKETDKQGEYCRKVEWLWVAESTDKILRFNEANFNRATFQRVKQGKEAIIDYMNVLLNKDNANFKTKPYIIIIDEINRGNISKILGELITLIESSKRIGASDEEKARGVGNESLEVMLPYSNETFGVPSNLYIIGTMNTADRSIALLDTALRRRFEFVEMMPDCKELQKIWFVNKIGKKDSSIESWEGEKREDGNYYSKVLFQMLTAINNRIEFLLDREHTIGHAFFFEKAQFYKTIYDENNLSEWERGEWYELSLDSLKEIFAKKIIPLLQEYFYDDYTKIQAVLNDNGMIRSFSKQKLEVNLSDDFVDSDKKVYRITDSNMWKKENFQRIYDSSIKIDENE